MKTDGASLHARFHRRLELHFAPARRAVRTRCAVCCAAQALASLAAAAGRRTDPQPMPRGSCDSAAAAVGRPPILQGHAQSEVVWLKNPFHEASSCATEGRCAGSRDSMLRKTLRKRELPRRSRTSGASGTASLGSLSSPMSTLTTHLKSGAGP